MGNGTRYAKIGRHDETSKSTPELNSSTKGTSRPRRLLALLLYLLALLLWLAVAGITIWPEMEASVFDRPLVIEETLGTLRCPPAVTRDENAALAATFTNDEDRDLLFRTLALISYRSAVVVDEVERWVELAPGETEVVRWALEPESAAYGQIILASVHVSSRGSTPPQQRGCGVMVLNLPRFTGTQYVLGMAAGGLLALAASGFFWLQGRPLAKAKQETVTRWLALLAAGVAGAMLAGLFNLWALGGLLLLFSALLLVSFTQH